MWLQSVYRLVLHSSATFLRFFQLDWFYAWLQHLEGLPKTNCVHVEVAYLLYCISHLAFMSDTERHAYLERKLPVKEPLLRLIPYLELKQNGSLEQDLFAALEPGPRMSVDGAWCAYIENSS